MATQGKPATPTGAAAKRPFPAPRPAPVPTNAAKPASSPAPAPAAKPLTTKNSPAQGKAVTAKPISPTPQKTDGPLKREELARVPAGASSQEALVRATGGSIERIGKVQTRNALVLNYGGRRFVYVRPQTLGSGRKSEYNTRALKQKLDGNGTYAGRDLDHVASTGVDGKRMGMAYVLAAFVGQDANRSHGRTNERGAAPVRESAKAFQGGTDPYGKHHVTYVTQEMVDKLAGKPSETRGHGTFRSDPTKAELKEISHALMQQPLQQQHLKSLTGGRSQMPAGRSAR